jgi:hypothetical protein
MLLGLCPDSVKTRCEAAANKTLRPHSRYSVCNDSRAAAAGERCRSQTILI